MVRSIKTIFCLILAALVLSPKAWAVPMNPGSDPTISLVKTIEVKEFEGLKFDTEDYTVEAGDSLYELLHKRGVVGSGIIPLKAMRLVKMLNPELTDLDIINPGQKLVLPSGPIEGLSPPEAIASLESGNGSDKKDLDAGVLPGEEASGDAKKKAPKYDNYQDAAKAALADGKKFTTIKVKAGDYLGKILREQGVPDKYVYSEFLRLTMAMNPEIREADIIQKGMEIKVPTMAAIAEAMVKPRSGSGTNKRTRFASLSTVDPSATRVRKKRPKRVTKKKTRRNLVSPPAIPASNSLGTRTALGLIFTRMGERFLAKGQLYLPLKDGGQITINTSSFPVIELTNGQRIVLDLDQRLPNEMVEMIRSNWSNYSVYRAKKGENLVRMISKLFEIGNYYRVQRRGEPYVINRDVRISIQADWIIWPTQNDYNTGRAVIITLPPSPSQGTSPELAAYLAHFGVKVIDFYARGNVIGPRPMTASSAKSVDIQNLNSQDVGHFLQTILDMAGQKYETELSIPLMSGKKDGSGYNFTIYAPIYFSRNGRNYVVTLEPLSSEVTDLLEKNKFKLVTRFPGESPQDMAKKLLSTMGLKTESGLTVQASGKSSRGRINVTMPGVLFHQGSRQTLLTASNVPQTLAPLISRPNLKVVRYQITNPS